jgi:hypothetical protein
MGAPAIFEKQIEIKHLHPASTEGVTDSGGRHRLSRVCYMRMDFSDEVMPVDA